MQPIDVVEPQPIELPKRESHQLKALLSKNIRLQSKQKCTNVCQILTPVICLLFTFLMKELASEGLPAGSVYEDNLYPYVFNNYQQFDTLNPGMRRNNLQWFLYNCQNQCDASLLGYNDGERREVGLLSAIPAINTNVSFYPDAYNNQSQRKHLSVPFFLPSNSTNNKELYKRLEIIQTKNFAYIKNGTGLDYLPDGAIDFLVLNRTSLKMNVQIDDTRDLDLHRLNGLTIERQIKKLKPPQEGTEITQKQIISAYGMLSLLDLFSSTYIRELTGQTMQSGYLFMPAAQDSKSLSDSIINTVAALVFPLALSLLFPVMLYGIVLQKEQKLIQMMKMNGLRITNYWIVYFLFNFLLCLITSLIFFLLGALVVRTTFFTDTSKLLLLLIMVGWSLAQIGLAAFFQTFLSKARSANIIGYLVAIWTMMIGSTLNIGLYQFPSHFPLILQMLPPFAFNRLFYLMLIECSDYYCYQSLSSITQEMQQCIAFLYIGFIFFFFLGAYLFEILPQELGVKRSPFFPFVWLYKLVTCRSRAISTLTTHRDEALRDYIAEDEEDAFSKSQRKDIEQLDNLGGYPLVINNLRKLYKKEGYPGMYPAVRSFNLKVADRETFGLVGPNGAGKTTLISMITGMFEPDNGNAWLGGYDITSSIEKAQLEMGVCPQFDLLWPLLSVQQHLYFYARLKSIQGVDLKERVTRAIQQVNLLQFRAFPASSLSGGMKRRLSIAISLVGDPRIVFLDEPSTGLDPDNRRQLWQVLAKCQEKRAMFLTTHIMEEADALCHRVGVLTHGTLRTVANQLKLKGVYGGGYRLNLNLLRENRKLVSQQSLHFGVGNEEIDGDNLRDSIKELVSANSQNEYQAHLIVNQRISSEIKRRFPGAELVKTFNSSLIYQIPLTFKVSDIFLQMKEAEGQLPIADVAITNCSLEDVFINVVALYDKQDGEPWADGDFGRNDIMQGELMSVDALPNEPGPVSDKHSINANSLEKPKPRQSDQFGSIVQKDRESILSEGQASPANALQKDGGEEEGAQQEEEKERNNNNNAQGNNSSEDDN